MEVRDLATMIVDAVIQRCGNSGQDVVEWREKTIDDATARLEAHGGTLPEIKCNATTDPDCKTQINYELEIPVDFLVRG